MTQLLSQLATLTTGRLTGAALVFFVTLILARLYGSDVLAGYSVALSAASILSVLLPLGFHAVATLFAAEYRAVHKSTALRAFTRYAHVLTFRNAAIAFVVLSAISFLVPAHPPYDLQLLAFFCVLIGYFMATIYINSALLIGMERHYWAHLPDMVLRPALLLLALVLLSLADLKSATGVLTALLGAVVITALVQSLAMKKALPVKGTEISAPETLGVERKAWWKIAPDHMKITLLWDYFFEFHILLAGVLLMPEQVATLFICFRIRQLAGFGLRSVYSLRMPRVMAANARGDKKEAQGILSSLVRISGAYAILVWIGMGFVGPYVLQAFGPEYGEAQSILLTLMATIVVRGLFGPSSVVLGMERHAAVIVKILFASLVLSLLLTWIGSIYFGVWSVAGAYFVSTTFSAIAIWWIAQNRTALNTAIWSKSQ